MTNLSQQIAELCGIEPKCINCGQTVSNENLCKMSCEKQKLPNFEEPENFVELLELFFDFDIDLTSKEKEDCEKFTHYVLSCLVSDLKEYEDSWSIKGLKAAIQNTEWRY